jgi:hypothetical protein
MDFHQALRICLVICFVLVEYNFQPVEASCNKNNVSCGDCVGLKDNCYWCENNKKCGDFVANKHKNQKNCQGSDVYYRQCYISSNLLIIILPCAAGVLLLIIGCCIYCCCCRKCCSKKKGIFDKEDKKLKREKNERKQLQDHRKAERQARNEEIRMKYGLKPASGDSRYQRLDP